MSKPPMSPPPPPPMGRRSPYQSINLRARYSSGPDKWEAQRIKDQNFTIGSMKWNPVTVLLFWCAAFLVGWAKHDWSLVWLVGGVTTFSYTIFRWVISDTY